MQEGETGHTVKKRPDRRACIETLVARPPRLQRATGHVKDLGRLTLGGAWRLQRMILLAQVGSLAAIPALVVLVVAALRLLDYGAHSDLLCTPLPWFRDGEG